MPIGPILLKNKEDFENLKKKLDKEKSYKHRHYWEPDEYPCLATSTWWDDPNGPYSYDHTFLYIEDIAPLVPFYINKKLEEEMLDE